MTVPAGSYAHTVNLQAPLVTFNVTDAVSMVPAGVPVWASSSPGNARSLRSLLGAGFTLVGSEVIIRRYG